MTDNNDQISEDSQEMCLADGSSIKAEEQALTEEPRNALVELPEKPLTFTPDPTLVRVDIRALYPPFWKKIDQLLKNCAARGVQYFATAGIRTYEEQNKLYAQGRTVPGKVVTQAKGGESYHNFGIAVDFTHDQNVNVRGLQPDWVVANYRVLAEEAQKLGLEPGFFWKFQDAPHVQLNISKVGLDLHRLRDAYASAGTIGVFHLLDQYQW